MTGKFLTEIDASEAGNLIAPVFASKGALDASGYNTAGGFSYAAGAGYVRDASAWRQLMFRDGAGGADFMLVSDSSGVYQAVAKSTVMASLNYWTLSGADVTRPTGDAILGAGSLFFANGQRLWFKDSAGAYKTAFMSSSNTSVFRSIGAGGIEFQKSDGSVLANLLENGNFGLGVTPNVNMKFETSASGGFSGKTTAGEMGLVWKNNYGPHNSVYSSEIVEELDLPYAWQPLRRLNFYSQYLNTANGNGSRAKLLTLDANNGNYSYTNFGASEFYSTKASTGNITKLLGGTDLRPVILDFGGASVSAGANNGSVKLSSVYGGWYSPLLKIEVAKSGNTAGLGDWLIAYAGEVLNGPQWTFQPGVKVGIGHSGASANILSGTGLDLNSGYGLRIRDFTAIGTVITDASGNISRANHFDYSGTLTASRTMTLGSNSFALDASGASSSPGTMLILKGKETSFTTRFIDYQNESGTTSFRMESSSTQVKLEAQNSHNLRIGGVTQTILSTGSDKNVIVHTDGWMSLHSGLSAHPATTPGIAAKWYLNGSMYFQNATARRQFATVEDDMIGTATQVITAATHTPGAADFFVQYNANSNSQVVTLGAALADGHENLYRCRQNTTNTITFNADTANGFVFYEQESGSATTTSIVTGGAGGTGFKAANRIYRVRRSGTVIWFS
jgi:hypothetical protein